MKQDHSLSIQKSPALPFVEMRQAHHSSACYQTHSHDEFSFGVIDAGSSTYHNQRHEHQINTGDVVTINPGDAHACNPKEGLWSYRMLFIDAAWVGKVQHELLGQASDYLPFEWDFSDAKNIQVQFNCLYQALSQSDNSLAAESALMAFFAGCFQSRIMRNLPVKAAYQQAGLVHQMVMDDLAVNHSLEHLADKAGLSRFQLIRSFKRRYGQAPHAYQLDQRIKKAKLLLQQGETLPDTAFALGFADQAHFQRNFKKRIAVTPKQYQSFFGG